ncbi:hypothetical protein OG897_26295 [Streptomyces sp. NBC_00237]|uniref:hypothetical protein n=1 Tax=Streptomyces sp. NBC_00237 TaxID=2975687 RepID=UPI00224DB118|nr:hypothetical protein [Streptomyces sp. NBC_00237]MCX5204953.1 hypothetical protein [Streptomyces sp. NBC_00237]
MAYETPPAGAMRPLGNRPPGLDIVRRTRLFATEGKTDGKLVLTSRDGTAREFPVGPGGITRAVHIDILGPEAAKRMPPSGSWGAIEFQRADGSRVLRVPLGEWLPEVSSLTARVGGRELLELTGAADLLRELRVPVVTVRSFEDPALENSATGPGTDLCVSAVLPVWHHAVRAGQLGWFALMAVALIAPGTQSWSGPLAGLFLLSYTGTDLFFWAKGKRQQRGELPGVILKLRPEAAHHHAVSRRFSEVSALYVLADDIVVRDSTGRERWFARAGTHAVTRVVRREPTRPATPRGPEPGRPLAVELRGPGGITRAVLPWEWWFGGDEGERNWQALAAAVGDAATETAPADRADDRDRHRGLDRRDSAFLAPLKPRTARSLTGFQSSVVKNVSPQAVYVFLLFTLLLGHTAAGPLTTGVAIAALLAALLPAVADSATSRLALDRPPRQTPPRQHSPEGVSR